MLVALQKMKQKSAQLVFVIMVLMVEHINPIRQMGKPNNKQGYNNNEERITI